MSATTVVIANNRHKMEPMNSSNKTFNRRQFLKAGLAASVICCAPLPAWAKYNLNSFDARTLSLYNTHTGETLRKVVYWEQGQYLHDALSDINYLLRDHRADAVETIDPKTLDILFALQDRFQGQKPIEIISGYRSPDTNAMLNRKSNGVAKRSYHMQGKAIDLRLPGVPLKTLRKVALGLQRGGVGYYPKSNFVHVDTGPLRSW
jgi:uncharacterized protein YcbK (DUF882 family)